MALLDRAIQQAHVRAPNECYARLDGPLLRARHVGGCGLQSQASGNRRSPVCHYMLCLSAWLHTPNCLSLFAWGVGYLSLSNGRLGTRTLPRPRSGWISPTDRIRFFKARKIDLAALQLSDEVAHAPTRKLT